MLLLNHFIGEAARAHDLPEPTLTPDAAQLLVSYEWPGNVRELRNCIESAVVLAKGEKERLAEDAHSGKFGSIARSVNIHIDKLGREAKSARKDMDQLLGPAPEGGLGTNDLLSNALPSALPSST